MPDRNGRSTMTSRPTPRTVTTITSRYVPQVVQQEEILLIPEPMTPPVTNVGSPAVSVTPTGYYLPKVGTADPRLERHIERMFRAQKHPYGVSEREVVANGPHEPWETLPVVKKARRVRSWRSENGCC